MLTSAFSTALASTSDARSDFVLERCSVQRGWRGLRLEIGHNRGCDVRSMRPGGHIIGMQITGHPVAVETYQRGRWVGLVLPSHQLFIHPAGTLLNIRHTAWTRWAIAIVDHSLVDLRPLQTGISPGWRSHDELLFHLFTGLVEQLCRETHDEPADGALSRALIHSLVLALGQYRRNSTKRMRVEGITPQTVARLKGWLVRNLIYKISVEDMAAQAGYCCGHFSRQFKQLVGMTPHAFLADVRLSAAFDLLLEGRAVGDVAHDCGFADQAHFSNAFKRCYGVSPSNFAKRSLVSPELCLSSAKIRS